MTPKEKAKELVDKYYKLAHSIEWTDNDTEAKAEKFNDELGADVLKYWKELAEQSALIAVDEILEIEYWKYMESGGKQEQIYWQEVKQEIEKL